MIAGGKESYCSVLDRGTIQGRLTVTVDEHSDIIGWADRRARAHAIPELIQRDWGIRTTRRQKKAAVESGKQTRAMGGRATQSQQ
jgi:hypothetical protein